MTHVFHFIRSTRHQICTIKQTKPSLSPYTMTSIFCSVALTIVFPMVIDAYYERERTGFDTCLECHSSKKKRYMVS